MRLSNLPTWQEVEDALRKRNSDQATIDTYRQVYWNDVSQTDDVVSLGPERAEALRSRFFNEPIRPFPESKQPEIEPPKVESPASTPEELYGSLKPRLVASHGPADMPSGWVETTSGGERMSVGEPSLVSTHEHGRPWGDVGERGLSPEQEDALAVIAGGRPETLLDIIKAAGIRGIEALGQSGMQQELYFNRDETDD